MYKLLLCRLLIVGAVLRCSNCEPSVIVVGGGPSGIAAASTLRRANVTVTLLEAEKRIGGRVNTEWFGDAFVEMGAEWCHGETDNVVYDMVKDLGILGSTDFHIELFSSDLQDVDKNFNYDLYNVFEEIYMPDGNKEQEEGVTVGEYFIKTYNETVRKKYGSQPDKLEFALNSLEYFHHLILGSEGAFSWFDTSATNDYRDCEGDLNLHWSGRGYKTIFDLMLGDDDRSFIKLGHEVTNIRWQPYDNRFAVRCSNGDRYHADYVIFTGSLGVLKHRHRSLFTPPLPREKIQAIRSVGIAAVAKVMLHFPVRWWPERNFTGFGWVWMPYHKEMLLVEFPFGPSKEGRSWLLEFSGLYPVESNPNVLSAWFTGNMVPEIERMADSIVKNGIVFLLNKFLGHKYNVSEPDQMLRTRWYSNDHFRGTYSYQTVESRKTKTSSNLVLSEPIYDNVGAPRLLFAGEVTNPKYYSTVHGAVETGRREAHRLINYIHHRRLTQAQQPQGNYHH